MVKNMSIKVRLTSAFLFIGLIVLIVGLIGWSSSSRLSSHIKTFADNTYPTALALCKTNEAQIKVQAGENVLLSPGGSNEQRKKALNQIQTALQEIKDGFDEYNRLPRDPEEDKIYNQVASAWDKWRATNQGLLQLNEKYMAYGVDEPRKVQVQLLQQGQGKAPLFKTAEAALQVNGEMMNYSVNKLAPDLKTSVDKMQDLLNHSSNVSTEANKQADKDVSQSNLWIGLGLIIGPVTAVIFGIVLSRSIANNMGELVKISNTIAASNLPSQMPSQGQDEIGKLQTSFYTVAAKISELVNTAEKISQGDLTTQIQPSEQQDQIGKLQMAFYTMNKNLNTLIRRIQQSGIQITTSATQIAASGKELEATVTEQLASTNEVTATATEIAATSKNLVKMMTNVASMTQTTATAASNSQDELQEMENTMRQLTEATSSITSKLGVMNKKASNINNVVVTITKVADRTSILSLNAAIEAEKAGEYGAGFAVVAREIRRLANQTAVATLEIEQIVKDMQAAVTAGVMEMDKFNKSVSDSAERVSKISLQIGKVINQVQSLPPQFEQVNQNMEEQSQGAQQISEVMGQLSESSHQTVDAFRETNSALEQLDEAAQALRQEISHFKAQS